MIIKSGTISISALQGPIVKTLEEQFCERWQDAGNVYEAGFWGSLHHKNNQVIFSSKTAIKNGEIMRLDEPKEVDPETRRAHL